MGSNTDKLQLALEALPGIRLWGADEDVYPELRARAIALLCDGLEAAREEIEVRNTLLLELWDAIVPQAAGPLGKEEKIKYILTVLPEQARGTMRLMNHIAKEREAQRERIAALERVVKSAMTLRNNTHGAMKCDEWAMRQAVGNTNYNCVRDSIEQFDAAAQDAAGKE